MCPTESMKPDYSTWLTNERIGTEETAWATAGFHHTYAAHIHLLRSKFNIESVLEIGCGTGWVPTQLPHTISYTGFDKNEEVLRIARLKNLASRNFIVADVRDLRLDAIQSLVTPQLVCSFAVLKHFSLDEWDLIFDKMVNLAPFGLFTMSVADENRDDGVDFHHVYITKERLAQALNRNGRDLIYCTVSWHGKTWEDKTGEEWIFAVRQL